MLGQIHPRNCGVRVTDRRDMVDIIMFMHILTDIPLDIVTLTWQEVDEANGMVLLVASNVVTL